MQHEGHESAVLVFAPVARKCRKAGACMIQSMTGFGRGESVAGNRRIAVEIKAVNHRYSEVQIRLPRRYNALEERLRQQLAASLPRGKADMFIKAENTEAAGASGAVGAENGAIGDGGDGGASDADVRIDKALALKYHSKVRDLAETLQIPMDFGLTELLALPGVLTVEETAEDMEEAWAMLAEPVEAAIGHVLAMRRAEGGRLAADFLQRLECLEGLRQSLLGYAADVVENYRQRLAARIAELMGKAPVDENRLVQEVAMFADRAGVDEELVRLDSHFRQFRELMDADEPVGRKLDFLCQEMHREINTVGSKANDLAMTKVVVEMKGELEKLREQVQNVQ